MIVLGVLILVSLLTTTAVFAGRMRFSDVTVSTEEETTDSGGKGGPKKNLADVVLFEANHGGSVTINNFLPLFAYGTLTGLGNQDVTVQMTATAIASGITCTNHGGELVEVQPRNVTVIAVQFILSQDYDKNGNTVFNVAASDPQLSVDQLCPNDNWSVEIDTLFWNGLAVVNATQPDGQSIEATFNCTQSDASGATCVEN